jgi:Ca2+-binding EF-hand superfamily protein
MEALLTLVDLDGDGLITKLETIRLLIMTDNNTLFAKMDADSNNMLTNEEFSTAMTGVVSDTTIQTLWTHLDTNHDGLIDNLELLPLNIATKLSTYFESLDTNLDGLLTAEELKTNLGSLATDAQLETMLTTLDLNQDGMLTKQETANTALSTLNTKSTTANTSLSDIATAQATAATAMAALSSLSSIKTSAGSVVTNTNSLTTALTTMNDHLNWIRQYSYNIDYYTGRDYQNTKAIAQNLTGWSYATGGIADGPLSGYGATLHGREAIIPLGDGNSVTAILQEPINRLGREAPDTAELRQALAELHAELKELRRDNQQIGANQIGELKEHNRRERKREVVPQQVEVVTP